jgi:hypothetical protein
MAIKVAPKIDTTVAADRIHVVADLSAAGGTNLRTISGKGKFAPQLTRLNNATTGNLSAVLTPEYGSDITIVVNAGQQYEVPCPIRAIANGGGALSAVFYWWAGNLSDAFTA